MARRSVNIEREMTWGSIRYDTLRHSFSYSERVPRSSEPYSNIPIVLNIVITRRCNMDCRYCVAKDFEGLEKEDLELNEDMIRWINRSPFMLLVLTGGEPLMPPYDAISMRLIESVKDRGIIVDTNGTFLPDHNTLSQLKKHKVMLRVSMDSTRPEEEIKVRQAARSQNITSNSAYHLKLSNIDSFLSADIFTAIQTVIYRKNAESLYQMIDWLGERNINQWYLQRLIPSYRYKIPPIRYTLKSEEYYPLVTNLASEAKAAGIACIPKMDLRHNSVFLLTSDGKLYTQGEAPGQKVLLGTIRQEIEYFEYVSPADHACRYYLAEMPQKNVSKAK